MFPSYLFKMLIKRLIYLMPSNGYKQYHHFPFDTLKPMPITAENLLCQLLKDIKSSGYENTIRISDGILLGLYRDGKLIEHDTDLDFDVVGSDTAFIKAIAHRLNWRIGREVKYANKVQQITYYDENELLIDFVFWYPDGQFMKNFGEKGCIRIQPRVFFDYLVSYKVSNIEFIMPKEIESWLVYRYGHSWQTPASSKGDWKEECSDLIRL